MGPHAFDDLKDEATRAPRWGLTWRCTPHEVPNGASPSNGLCLRPFRGQQGHRVRALYRMTEGHVS